jgi:steroid delta-isomerase-like uncharacterized protein
MATEENKALVRQFVEEVQNSGNLALIDELVAATFINHSAPPGVPPSVEGVRVVMAMFQRAFPDGRMTIEDMVAEGDSVVTRKTFRGTHGGDFMGLPPTGKAVRIGLIDILRITDGRITDHWLESDTLGLLQQLGAVPAPGQPGG